MTLQASLVDIDILIAAGGAVADRLAVLGQLDPRVVTPSQLGLQAAAGLGARLVGAAPGQLFLLTGDEAGAALAGAGADGGLEPALADVVATLKMQVGDVRPEDVRRPRRGRPAGSRREHRCGRHLPAGPDRRGDRLHRR